jgi:hypothetical protein
MTNLEAIKAKGMLNYPVDDNVFIVGMMDAGIDPNGTYSASNSQAIELCMADLCLILISSAKQVQDDGYSVTMQDIASLWKLRWYFRKKWGLPDDTPIEGAVLKNATFKW